MSELKTCTKCGKTKQADEFYKRCRAKDGLRCQCKACDAAHKKAYNAEHKEDNAARCKAYRATHAEEIAAYCAAHAEEITARSRIYRAEHADKVAAYGRVYCAEHADEVAARMREWRQANPEKKAAYKHRRRALQRAATVEDFDIGEVWERDNYTCVYCGETQNLSVDHIKPLAKGGSHSPDNLCVACISCNSSKRATPLIRWLATTNRLDALTQGALL